MSKLKIGDTVKVIRNYKDGTFGRVGKIVHIKDCSPPFLVDFGEGFDGHSGGGFDKFRHTSKTCLWFHGEDLIDFGGEKVSQFKVGDIITGNAKADRRYNFTTSDAQMKVVGINAFGWLEVEIIAHSKHKRTIGAKHWVEADRFILVEPEVEIVNKHMPSGIQVRVEKFIFNGDKTTMVYYDDKGKKKTEVAICMDGDTFSKEVGKEVCLRKATIKMLQRSLKQI